MQPQHVVTSFLLHESAEGDRLLLLRRSDKVITHQGLWAAVFDYLEPGATPEEQAWREIAEEVGLGPGNIRLLVEGQAFHAPDPPSHTEGLVYPFLFQVLEPDRVRLNWEHAESRWIAPEAIIEFQTVPWFREALSAVYPLEALLLTRGREVERRVARLAEDRERGSMALAQEAALLLAEVARTTLDAEAVERACRLVADTRPVMASVRNVALTVLATLRSTRDPLGAAARSAQRMASILEASPRALSRFARVYLHGTAVTLSSSTAVLEAVLANRDTVARVIVAEGRPLLEGQTLAARLVH
jgi:ADP-ribose pyrophosphatase YjhB (NUDIX family)